MQTAADLVLALRQNPEQVGGRLHSRRTTTCGSQ